MKKTYALLGCFIALLFSGCSGGADGNSIDYGSRESWLALPGSPSVVKETPRESGLSSLEDSAEVDVFYVHPTDCTRTDVNNCALEDENDASLFVMREQASAFNAVGRIYAPKYRQMVLGLYHEGDTPALQDALTFAYNDVKDAFRYYLKHYNNGRPFIIASHSQGTDHSRRLIMEEVHGRPIQDQFVAAWTPGQPTPYKWFEDDLPGIPPCTAPDQISCIAVWQTFGEGFTGIAEWNAEDVYWDGQSQRWLFPHDEATYNVNPLTWTTGPESVSRMENLGSVPLGVVDTNFVGIHRGVVGARNHEGYLIVSPVPLPINLYIQETAQAPLVYHSFDYALFWLATTKPVRTKSGEIK